MRCLRARRQSRGVDREAVVHAGNLDRAVGKPLHRMVRATVALMHLFSSSADRKAKHLVPQADAEQRLFGFQPLLDYRLVEHAMQIPAMYKIKGTTRKYILKKTMQGTLPKQILAKEKKGFKETKVG